MVAIARDDAIAGLERHLHADDDRLLADIEVAEPPDEAHSVELARLLFEPPDEQHVAKRGQLLLFGEVGHRARCVVASTALDGRWNGRFVGGYRHMAPQEKGRPTPVLAQLPLAEIVPARKRMRDAVGAPPRPTFARPIRPRVATQALTAA